MEIVNTWTSKKEKIEFFTTSEKEKVFEIGDYSIFRLSGINFLYTFKNLAINQLAGLNKEHLTALHNDQRPTEPQKAFLFDRAKENLQKAINLTT